MKVQIHITEDQARYLHEGPSADGERGPQGDLCITQVRPAGWIFVEQAQNVGQDGSGVWVDSEGKERHP